MSKTLVKSRDSEFLSNLQKSAFGNEKFTFGEIYVFLGTFLGNGNI
jgi:hypothetical protein